MDTESNENCLAGMQCPKCKSLEPFRINISSTVLMFDDGSQPNDMYNDEEWDQTSYCQCYECGFQALVKDFQVEDNECPPRPF